MFVGRGSLYSKLSAKVSLSFQQSQPPPKRTLKGPVECDHSQAYILQYALNENGAVSAAELDYNMNSHTNKTHKRLQIKKSKSILGRKRTTKKVVVSVPLSGLLNV